MVSEGGASVSGEQTTITIFEIRVGDKIKFAEERLSYTVQARDDRYLICTKPFNLQRTVIYTIVDLVERIRGTENLVFGFGQETRKQCEETLARLTGVDRDGKHDMTYGTEISHRNRVALNVDWVRRFSV